MDERLRQALRAAEAGDWEAAQRAWRAVCAAGLQPNVSVEERARRGWYDSFATWLREDIVEEAQRARRDREDCDHVSSDPAWWPVELRVNGARLSDWANGDYGPQLPAHAVYLPTRHLLGEPYVGPGAWATPEDEDKTLLLVCECGEAGCGRLVARVIVTETAVVWTDLEHRPARSAPRPPLPALVFARSAYEDALRDPV